MSLQVFVALRLFRFKGNVRSTYSGLYSGNIPASACETRRNFCPTSTSPLSGSLSPMRSPFAAHHPFTHT